MLRCALLCAVLGLLRAQPFCPQACKCVVRDAAQCSGGSVAHIAALGLPTNLTHILLFRMGQGVLQNHSFSGMTVLQRLMLSDSHVSDIAPGTFNDLIKLKTLKLSRNKITHLSGSLLDKMVLLEQLFLDHNALKGIDQNMFQKLVNLQELYLNQNQLVFLPANLFTNLGKLKLLDLSGNNLTHLPKGLLGAQRKLEKLLLHSNQLSSVDSGLLDPLSALKELHLDRNHLRSIAPGAFDRLGNLNSLTLSRNRLQSLPPALFLHSSSLTWLTLFENPLEELPDVLFGEMAGLRELWLNGTQLRTLPAAAFRNLSGLRVLGVTRNPRLGALPGDVLRGLDHLRHVSLCHNRLRALPRALFRNLSSLETVQLEHNQLEALPGDLFEALPQLRQILLGRNPWLCDCGLWPFLQWLRRHPTLLGGDQPPRCGGPEPRAGLEFRDVVQGDPWCPDPRGPLLRPPPSPPTQNSLEAPAASLLPNSSPSWPWVQLVATVLYGQAMCSQPTAVDPPNSTIWIWERKSRILASIRCTSEPSSTFSSFVKPFLCAHYVLPAGVPPTTASLPNSKTLRNIQKRGQLGTFS
ncbi:platelet glycoprotein V [Nannospalax galili]|uniref:platelet glycoprotein V n=1 Tax=Nannospalax galili TaxID=1026970 RepID=UPI0004ED18A8|nr:platelet glycoprotein V [Nannospalax galili]